MLIYWLSNYSVLQPHSSKFTVHTHRTVLLYVPSGDDWENSGPVHCFSFQLNGLGYTTLDIRAYMILSLINFRSARTQRSNVFINCIHVNVYMCVKNNIEHIKW